MTDEFKQTPQPTRLGKQNERRNSRPIKIECETTEQKYMMLKRSKTLSRHGSTRDVYIGPDPTRKERLAGKDLREELNARRARGEENIIIRRNEIVTAPVLLVAPLLLAAPQKAAPYKLDELEAMIEDMKPDLIFITETWLNPDIKNAEVMLSGFSEPIRKDRTGRRVGGCIMYAKQGLTLRDRLTPLECWPVQNTRQDKKRTL